MKRQYNTLINLPRKIYKDSLLKNSIYLMIANFSNLTLGFFFWVIAARYYTPNDIGTISAILSSIFLISMISSIGLPKALIFYLPKNLQNVNKIINSCLMASIVASIILSIIFISGLEIWTPDLRSFFNSLYNIMVFIIFTIIMTISGLVSAAFMAGKRSSFHLAKQTIFDSIKIIPLALLANFKAIGIFLSLSIGLIFSVIIGFILLSKVWKYSPTIIFDPIIKSMARFSAGNYIAEIFYNFPRLVFPIMIMNLISIESAGYFFIAMAVATLLYGISQAISNSLLVESYNEKEFWNNVRKAIRLNIGLLIPGILFFIIFGKFVLNIFNHSYAENATVTMIILTITSIPVSLISIFTTVRNAQNRVGSVVKTNMIIASITIGISIPLMKIYGIEGAAIAYLIANTITAMAVIYKTKNPVKVTSRLIKGEKSRFVDIDRRNDMKI